MQKHNTSFTATPINRVNVKRVLPDKSTEFVRAIYAKLDTIDPPDINLVDQINKTWPKVNQIITEFCKDFTKYKTPDIEYAVLELNDIVTPFEYKKVAGFLKTQIKPDGKNKKFLYLSQICAKPEAMGDNPDRTLKGVGEILLGQAFHKARKIGATKLEFYSVCNEFYRKTFKNAGIDLRDRSKVLVEGNEYTFYPKAYDQYIKYCEKEYGTNFSAKI